MPPVAATSTPPPSPSPEATGPFGPLETPAPPRRRALPLNAPPDNPTLDRLCHVIRRHGLSDDHAAEYLGLPCLQLAAWKLADHALSRELRMARAEFRAIQLAIVQAAALAEGGRGWRAAAWLLERLCPEGFAASPDDRRCSEHRRREVRAAEEQAERIAAADRARAEAATGVARPETPKTPSPRQSAAPASHPPEAAAPRSETPAPCDRTALATAPCGRAPAGRPEITETPGPRAAGALPDLALPPDLARHLSPKARARLARLARA